MPVGIRMSASLGTWPISSTDAGRQGRLGRRGARQEKGSIEAQGRFPIRHSLRGALQVAGACIHRAEVRRGGLFPTKPGHFLSEGLRGSEGAGLPPDVR